MTKNNYQIGNNASTHFIVWTSNLAFNLTKFIITAIALVTCLTIFWKWNTIPIHEHYINIERFAAGDTCASCKANVVLNVNNGRTIDERLPRAKTSFDKCWFQYNTKDTISSSRIPYLKIPNLSPILGPSLYNMWSDKCREKNVDPSIFKNLVYFRDTRSVRTKVKNTTDSIYVNNILENDVKSTIKGVNSPCLENIPMIVERANRYTSTQYLNKENEYVTYVGFSMSEKSTVLNDLEFFDTEENGWPPIFRLEDITQAYYRIRVDTYTFDEVSLTIDFVGATNFSGADIEPSAIKMSSLEYDNIKKSFGSTITFHASFSELQNLQIFRSFFLTAIMTLLLTLNLKSLWNLLRVKIRKKKEPINENNTSLQNHTETKFVDEREENKMTKGDLITKFVSEIEEMLQPSTIQTCDEYESNLYVISNNPCYPSCLISIAVGNAPEWMGEEGVKYIFVNVAFFESHDKYKNKSWIIKKDRDNSTKDNLYRGLCNLVEGVYDASGNYDISLYPSEDEAKELIRQIFDDNKINRYENDEQRE